MQRSPSPGRAARLLPVWLILALALAGCAANARANVLGYLLEQRRGLLPPRPHVGPRAGLVGQVVDGATGQPLRGATVVVGQRYGTPHWGVTDENGWYTIQGIPPGLYIPAAVAPGYDEAIPRDGLGLPWLVELEGGAWARAPTIRLPRRRPPPLPTPLPQAVRLEAGQVSSVTAPFPEGARALRQRFRFRYRGSWVDTLRLYRPETLRGDEPLLFAVYPGVIDGWEPVNVAFADAGFVVVAIGPIGARGVDVDAHAQDARVALALARGGFLGVDLAERPAVAVGGSFSSAVLYRLLRDERAQFRSWVTVGGIADAFAGAAAFYRGELEIPENYRLVIPALGPANLNPLPYLRYSPVYNPQELPSTLIIHTDADRVLPIQQAWALEAALRAAGVPVRVFYYRDVSHYLQIGENITEAGKAMYHQVVAFIRESTGPQTGPGGEGGDAP